LNAAAQAKQLLSAIQQASIKKSVPGLFDILVGPQVTFRYVRCVGLMDATGKIFWISKFPDTSLSLFLECFGKLS